MDSNFGRQGWVKRNHSTETSVKSQWRKLRKRGKNWWSVKTTTLSSFRMCRLQLSYIISKKNYRKMHFGSTRTSLSLSLILLLSLYISSLSLSSHSLSYSLYLLLFLAPFTTLSHTNTHIYEFILMLCDNLPQFRLFAYVWELSFEVLNIVLTIHCKHFFQCPLFVLFWRIPLPIRVTYKGYQGKKSVSGPPDQGSFALRLKMNFIFPNNLV